MTKNVAKKKPKKRASMHDEKLKFNGTFKDLIDTSKTGDDRFQKAINKVRSARKTYKHLIGEIS